MPASKLKLFIGIVLLALLSTGTAFAKLAPYNFVITKQSRCREVSNAYLMAGMAQLAYQAPKTVASRVFHWGKERKKKLAMVGHSFQDGLTGTHGFMAQRPKDNLVFVSFRGTHFEARDGSRSFSSLSTDLN